MLSNVTRSQRRFLRKCALFIIITLFLTLVLYSSLEKITNRFNYYFTWCDECVSSLLLNNGFTIDEVVVTGNKFTNEKDIFNLIDRAEPIMYVSLSKLINSIQSVSKWIKNVSVHRILPNTVKINIEEHEPFAMWQDNNNTSIIDSEGKIIIDKTHFDVIPTHDARVDDRSQYQSTEIAERKDLIDNLVVITGQNSLSNLKFVKDILENKTQLSSQISSFISVGNRRWNIVLDNELTVKLPEDNPYGAWDYLNHLHNTTDFTFSDWSIIDMRIADKIFVKR
ncbi:cell division protein FtsQ/DivIB [Wolbachia endosymbiont of Folsomia candida]|uniref:cell division protein FtsQ/DivIB n=1 Tax=Wolbachia endosymbiont of Folsomia candida TaxID=169402 RepID=UPI000A71E026|nr:cell division protein FtsQ/DivIB [Wolbachia endosymbiont of Folsomia candida]APR97962.1 cell division protein FtsQ [Wolbachia endosymbiont of Folsomia candida]